MAEGREAAKSGGELDEAVEGQVQDLRGKGESKERQLSGKKRQKEGREGERE